MTDKDRQLIERYDMLRSAAQNLQRQFDDCGGHYEFTGTMNDVNWLRDAIEAVEDFMILNDIPIPRVPGDPLPGGKSSEGK